MTKTEQRLAELEAEVAELRRAVTFTTALGDAIQDQGYREGGASVLGHQAEPRPPRLRHLQAVQGGLR